MTTIIPTIRAEHLAKRMKLPDGFEVIYPHGNKEGQRFFPDDEVYLKVPDIEKVHGRVVVLHSGMPDPNGGLVELEMLLEIIKTSKATKIEIFFAYFPYGMQDHANEIGETNTAENLIKKLIHYYGVKKIYTLDAHFFGQPWVKEYPITNISALPLLRKTAEKEFPEVIYLAPDKGSQRRAGLKGTTKKRKDSFNVNIEYDEEFVGAVKGNIIGTVDDLVETGGTMVKFATACKECGAEKAIALITHGVLVSGIKRLAISYSKLFLSNSVNREDSNVDVSQLIFEYIASSSE